MSEKKAKKRTITLKPGFIKDLVIIVEPIENSQLSTEKGNWCIMVGNIKLSPSRTGKKGVVHITTGRADSLEGGDFRVCELEEAIQDFFDKNF